MSKVAPNSIENRSITARWRWCVAMALFTAVVIGFFDRISIAVLFTRADFYNDVGIGFDPTRFGLLMTVFLIAYAISSIFLSVLGDLFGPGRMLALAAGAWGVCMVCMGNASSYGSIIAARIGLGVMEGPQFSLIAKIVYRWFPVHERGRANAIWLVGSPVGSAIGFPLIFWLVGTYGWRGSLHFLGALSLFLVMPLILVVVRDRSGQALQLPQGHQSCEAKARCSIFLANPRFWLLTFYGCGSLMYLWGLNSWLPSYFTRERHMDLHHVGVFSALPFIMMFAGELISGVLVDRTRRRAWMCFIGLFGAGCLMYLGIILADLRLAATAIALSAGFWGFGLPAQYALAMEIVPASVTAAGIGTLNGIANLAGSCAPALIGWIIGRTGNFGSGMFVIVCASLAGAITILPLARRTDRTDPI
ncbi:Sugar phosphate permease [Burkholderia sp. OK233]|nr:Sugar phosphate permease [Burkholderia sp. OK233]